MTKRVRTPGRLVNELFSSHEEMIRDGIINPSNEHLVFTSTYDGDQVSCSAEREVDTKGRGNPLYVHILLHQGKEEGDYHSLSFTPNDNHSWNITHLYGPETELERDEMERDGVADVCGEKSIATLVSILRTAQVIAPAT